MCEEECFLVRYVVTNQHLIWRRVTAGDLTVDPQCWPLD